MADKHETIADIAAEKRHRAADIRAHLSVVPIRKWDQIAEAEELEADAARIAAANAREVEHALDHATHHAEKVAAGNCRDCVLRDSNGDAAKLREAVKAVVDVGYPHNFQKEAPHIREYCYDITRAINKCFAALVAPPRNCDRYADYQTACKAWMETKKPYAHKPDGYDFAVWLFAKAEGGAK